MCSSQLSILMLGNDRLHQAQVADMYNAQAIHGVNGGNDAANEEY